MEELFKKIKKSKLSENEKGKMWRFIESRLSVRREKTELKPLLTFFGIQARRSVVFSAAVLVVLAGAVGGTVSFADASAPGDFLYPVDRAIEEFRLVLASGETKEKLKIQYSIERVVEAEKVLASTDMAGSISGDEGEEEAGSEVDVEKIEDSEKALSVALQYVEEQKASFEADGNEEGALALEAVIAKLKKMAEMHVSKIEKIEVAIKDKGGEEGVQAKIKLSSENIKTEFEFEREKDKEKFKFSFQGESKKEGGDKHKSDEKEDESDKDDSEKDEPDGSDDEDHKNKGGRDKVIVCHKDKETIEVSEDSLFGHLKHNDELGACDEVKREDDDEGDEKDKKEIKFVSISHEASTTSAKIIWETKKDTVGIVYYGVDSPVSAEDGASSGAGDNSKYKEKHEAVLTDLSPGTVYYYVIAAKDKKGRELVSEEREFTTGSEEDVVSPVISNIQVSASTTFISVGWNTNEETEGEVFISTSTPASTSSAFKSEEDNFLGLAHEVIFTNLVSGKDYYLFIIAKDNFGNISISDEISATTKSEDDNDPPAILNLSVSNVTSSAATVSFSTDEKAVSSLWISDATPVNLNESSTLSLLIPTLNHQFSAQGLSASTTYYYVVRAEDESGNYAFSGEESFKTSE